MLTNRLAGSNTTEFTIDGMSSAIQLHYYMQTVTDTVKPRLAIHEYLKRDGAEVEWMGNSPNTYRFTLVFVGPNWKTQYNAFAALLNGNPKGVLVHPVFGRQRVACQGIDSASIDINAATNCVTVPISFITDDIDAQLEGEQSKSASEKESDVTTALDEFLAAVAVLRGLGVSPSAATVAAISSVSTTAAAYAAAAAAASNDNIPNPALGTLLSAVEAATSLAIAGIETDTADYPNASAFPAISGCEQVYANCLELADAVDAARPVVIDYTVPGDTGLIAMCARLYGAQADDQIEQVLVLNRIANPALIPGGTVLKIPTPTNT